MAGTAQPCRPPGTGQASRSVARLMSPGDQSNRRYRLSPPPRHLTAGDADPPGGRGMPGRVSKAAGTVPGSGPRPAGSPPGSLPARRRSASSPVIGDRSGRCRPTARAAARQSSRRDPAPVVSGAYGGAADGEGDAQPPGRLIGAASGRAPGESPGGLEVLGRCGRSSTLAAWPPWFRSTVTAGSFLYRRWRRPRVRSRGRPRRGSPSAHASRRRTA